MPQNNNGNTSGSNGVFPELVIDMGPSAARTTGAVTASPLGQLVDSALREVLAWRPRAGDPRGFVAALNQAFTISEIEGHTEFAWTPRSYTVQADMGAVTGAQASIYARAKAALDQSVPLLEGLFPLRADDDAEDIEAIRALVIGKLTGLVDELGQVGGPRILMIKDLFDSLLNLEESFDQSQDITDPTVIIPDDPDQVKGLLGDLSEKFGLVRDNVNTIDEEHNLTNYLIVVDLVIALGRSWEFQRLSFGSNPTKVFLGTQLVLLSRALGVVAESVQELYFVLDSVFLGAAERQIVQAANTGLTIAELFGWVEYFATEEAPRMIRDGGKDGVIAFRSTVAKMRSLVESVRNPTTDLTINPRLTHPRTQSALAEVSQYLLQVQTLTEGIGPSSKGGQHTPESKLASDSAQSRPKANKK